MRKILESLKSQGKTIFFNSHLLPDVHDICDKVGVLHRGKMVGEGRVADIAAGNYQGLEDFFMQVITESEQKYREQGHAAHHIERGG